NVVALALAATAVGAAVNGSLAAAGEKSWTDFAIDVATLATFGMGRLVSTGFTAGGRLVGGWMPKAVSNSSLAVSRAQRAAGQTLAPAQGTWFARMGQGVALRVPPRAQLSRRDLWFKGGGDPDTAAAMMRIDELLPLGPRSGSRLLWGNAERSLRVAKRTTNVALGSYAVSNGLSMVSMVRFLAGKIPDLAQLREWMGPPSESKGQQIPSGSAS
ncbi:MAG: hypothetical protein ACRC0L_09735, partial [Angustibacter sp.]